DASVVAEKLAEDGVKPHVITVDPPRKGLAPEVISAMVQMAPERIVYVSCDPATLARDLKLFAGQGYTAVKAEAVDLFPRTAHVETCVLMVGHGI
ncbi:MAG: 23S rRNA (uracil(1939)-C(5))-methyltransferase RlmD, partial [Christensenellaceae bacterium]